ncbi:hypothetical protein Vafri_21843 [Volvox africanus]|uniref:Uncharacterized protein n=1 Tax=Volvox africanus TaxID=51714 RepID=A0A8J4FFA5_9CHLO|nr:hypothetical protein Vafri_21843 [Volvox africanus]
MLSPPGPFSHHSVQPQTFHPLPTSTVVISSFLAIDPASHLPTYPLTKQLCDACNHRHGPAVPVSRYGLHVIHQRQLVVTVRIRLNELHSYTRGSEVILIQIGATEASHQHAKLLVLLHLTAYGAHLRRYGSHASGGPRDRCHDSSVATPQ